MVLLANQHEILPGENLNGQLTLGENIADLGGAEIAYQAFKKAMKRNGKISSSGGFRLEQRFFMNMAFVWRLAVKQL